MPAPAASPRLAGQAIDRAAFLTAVTWSLEYLLDPKRGQGKNLPTDKELKEQFAGGQNLSINQVAEWIYSKFGTNDLAKISQEQEKIKGVLDEISQELGAPKEAAVPKFTTADLAAARAAKGRPSALGVLAELEAIEPILRRHNQETGIKLTQSLKPQVQSLITSLGIKDLPQDQLENLSGETAQEVARETLENAPKIADLAQIQDVITDSVVQTLLVNPILASKLTKLSEVKLVEKTAPVAAQITQQYQKDLEKSAVLGSLAEIGKLQKPNQEILETIADHTQQIIESHAPLTTPGNQQILTASLGTYLVNYFDEVKKQLPKISPTAIPSFKDLQKYKEIAHNKATAKIATAISQNESVKKVGQQIGYSNLTASLAANFRLAPPKVVPPSPLTLPAGAFLILNSDRNLNEASLALLAHDQEWFNKELKKTAAQIENFQKRKALSYQQRKEQKQLKKNLARLQKAQELKAKKPKRHLAYLNLFRNNLDVSQASYTTRSFFNERYGYFIPRTIINSPRFGPRLVFASIAPGSLSLFGKIAPGFSSSISQLAPAFGMGMAVGSINPVRGVALGIGRKIRNIAGAVFGRLGLYFLALGKAAFTGFLIGAAAGATAGLAFGIGVSIALGPIGWIAAPVIIPLSMFTGGIIGGTAGGLIGLGLASGSTTAVTTGIGAGIGGTIGGYAGFTAGSIIGNVIGDALFVATGGLAAPLVPVFTALGASTGAFIGAFIGSLIGAGVGYLFGHYVLPFFKGAFDTISSAFTGSGTTVGTASAGFFSAAGSFFTGLASAAWGGLSAAGGAIVGFFGGAANFIVGGLGSLAVPASAAAIPVAGSIGAVAVGGTIVSIVTATAFFNPGGEGFELPPDLTPPGETQFFTVTKTSNPEKIANNSNLPQDITFTITLTARDTKLTNIQVTDQLKVQGKSGNFNVTQDKSGNPISPPCADTIPQELPPREPWRCELIIIATSNFADSVVANTVTVTATPEGGTATIGTAVATTTIGSPPTICATIEFQGSWAVDEKANVDKTCRELDKSPQVTSLLQRAGTIYLIRAPNGSLGTGVCGVVSANTVKIACPMLPESFAKYVIIHELGHVLGVYNGTVYQSYLNAGAYAQEGLMPTYPFAPSEITWGVQAESFAEMIADYVVSKIHTFNPRAWSGYPSGPWVNPGPGWTTFKNDKPAHYNFAKTEIFGGVEY